MSARLSRLTGLPMWGLVIVLAMGATWGVLTITAMNRAAGPEAPSVGKPVRQGQFELAFTARRAGTLLVRWGKGSGDRLREVIGLDFDLIPAYVLFFGSLCLIAARGMSPGASHRLGTGILLTATVLAGLLDALENVAMLAYLQASSRTWAPPVAGIFSIGKWGLLAVVLIMNAIRLVRPGL